jgi:hypothetical protein
MRSPSRGGVSVARTVARVTVVTAQDLFAVALVLAVISLSFGLASQRRRILLRRQAGGGPRVRSTPLEVLLILLGCALIVLAFVVAGVGNAFP